MIGALDAIPLNSDDPVRDVYIRLYDEDYFFNFPLKIDYVDQLCFGFPGGAFERVMNLLDEDSKNRCLEDHDWLIPFLKDKGWISR